MCAEFIEKFVQSNVGFLFLILLPFRRCKINKATLFTVNEWSSGFSSRLFTKWSENRKKRNSSILFWRENKRKTYMWLQNHLITPPNNHISCCYSPIRNNRLQFCMQLIVHTLTKFREYDAKHHSVSNKIFYCDLFWRRQQQPMLFI